MDIIVDDYSFGRIRATGLLRQEMHSRSKRYDNHLYFNWSNDKLPSCCDSRSNAMEICHFAVSCRFMRGLAAP